MGALQVPATGLSPLDEAAAGGQPWHVVFTQPRREQMAVLNLGNQGFETYFPQYKIFGKKAGAASVTGFEPMFPRYVFFRPSRSGQSMSGARSTRGVSFVLTGAEGPAILKDDELMVIRACELARNQVQAEAMSPFQPGLPVRLKACGLQGLQGLVQAVSARRVTLLLEILGRMQTVHVEHHQLELA